jgi:hypothetical protein
MRIVRQDRQEGEEKASAFPDEKQKVLLLCKWVQYDNFGGSSKVPGGKQRFFERGMVSRFRPETEKKHLVNPVNPV